jgi:hypothetical protein
VGRALAASNDGSLGPLKGREQEKSHRARERERERADSRPMVHGIGADDCMAGRKERG